MHHLDCRTLRCPMCIVRVAQTARELASGDLLEVVADDPAFVADIRAWASMTESEIETLEAGPETRVVVRIG